MGLVERLLLAILIVRALGNPRKTAPRIRQVVLVGDSYAVGLQQPLRLLLAEHGIPFRTAAQEGLQTAAVLQLASGLMPLEPGGVLVVSAGANDAAAGFGGEESRAATEARRFMENTTGRVLWLEPPTNAGYWASPARGLTETLQAPPMTLPDGQHPEAIGYREWAQRIVEKLKI